MWFVLGQNAHVDSVLAGQVGEDGAMESVLDDYTDIHVSGMTSVEEHDHYINTERVNVVRADGAELITDPGSEDQAARPRDYERLDPSFLDALRQPQAPHEYARLAIVAEVVASTQQDTEENEMIDRDY